MKANCWYGTHRVEVEDVPDPTILNPRDATHGIQRDVRSANSVMAGRESVAEFMQQHTEEDQTHEQHAMNRGGRAALC